LHKDNRKNEALLEQRHNSLPLKGIRACSEPSQWIMPAPILSPLPKLVILQEKQTSVLSRRKLSITVNSCISNLLLPESIIESFQPKLGKDSTSPLYSML